MEKTNYFSNMLQESTLSYKIINEEDVNEENFKHSNIIGCTIQNSTFKNINFNSSDFDGTILIQCEFLQSDWSRTDCCSLTASNTQFIGIDFTLSTMRDCDFKSCTFINCKFDHIALSGSNFEHCKFKDIYLIQSSTYLNTYINCNFANCDINGNFYYNLLIDNTYTNSSFNKKLFAYNYYLMGDRDLAVLGFDTLQKEDLKTYLMHNKLLINLVILELNETNDVDMSLILFITAIGEILKTGLLVREEQLQFIYKFLRFLLKGEMISAVTIAETLSCLEKTLVFFNTQQNFAYEKCKDTLNLIKNELFQTYQTMGQNISYAHNASESDMKKMIKIVYEKEPQIPICSILNEIKDSLGINAPDAVRVKTEIGSFHEWISCYNSTIQCLQLFIDILALGYTVISSYQKKKDKSKVSDDEKNELPDTTSEQMLSLLNKALSKQKINPEFSQSIQIIVKNDIIASKKFRGYSKSNIQSIEIVTKNS